jgi:threonine/homoserine/homoserine lactone efflux protein
MIQHWLAFAAASAVLVAIPGPTVLMVVAQALGHGRRATAATVLGVSLGDLSAITASMLGVGALLAASADLFTLVKWAGAIYLVYTGLRLWRAPVGDLELTELAASDPARIFWQAYWVTALNPKGIVFFVAFLPQFFDLTRAVAPQMVLFAVTFVAIATLNSLLYALTASAARQTIRRPRVQRAVNRLGGTILIAAGVFTAVWQKAPA